MTMNETDSVIRTKGSLCSGIGGLDQALPGEPEWMAETNQAAARILKREHPEVPNLGDITVPDFPATRVDLLASGDPCQSMSTAGRQNASEDERFLWPHVIDIIRRTLPDQIFLENVQNLVSVALRKKDRTWGAVPPEFVHPSEHWQYEKGSVLKMRLDDLRAAGYAARWTVLGACAVGAPHHRHRWFLRAVHVGAGAPEAVRVLSKCGAPRTGGRVLMPTPTTADGKGGPGASGRAGGLNLRTTVALLPTPRARDWKGSEGDIDRTTRGRHAGDALPTEVARLLLTPRATDGTNGGPNQRGRKGDLAMGSACRPEVWGKFAEAVALWESITDRSAPDPTVPAPRGGRRLNPALSEWMMGYPDGYVTGELDRNAALEAIGNGVVSLQGATAWDLLA
jgi:DNA (cytosine-5)-methyltransferase 1